LSDDAALLSRNQTPGLVLGFAGRSLLDFEVATEDFAFHKGSLARLPKPWVTDTITGSR
jgi:hypothetical protein